MDLKSQAAHEEVQDYLMEPTIFHYERLSSEYLRFIEISKAYDQIRLIDGNGQEKGPGRFLKTDCPRLFPFPSFNTRETGIISPIPSGLSGTRYTFLPLI